MSVHRQSRGGHRPRRGVAWLALAMAVVFACSSSAAAGAPRGDGPPPLSFYRVPASVPARPPGTVFRALRLGSPPSNKILGTRLTDDDGTFVGTAWIGIPAISGATLSLLATGDHRSLNGLLRLVRPARRPGAVLFADLEGSTSLSRTLPAAEYFRVVRRLMTCIDGEIVKRGGLVGKHAGDGASAFFLAEQHDGESAAARACIDAARAIRDRTDEIAECSDLPTSDVAVRFGLHWGATLYVGRLLTSGRADITALGDAVNEAARIEACASGGLALASKDLIERLDPADAATLRLESAALRFTP